jgi:predicted nucleotidyltransferase
MSSNGRDEVGEVLEKRRSKTAERMNELKSRLLDAEKLCGDKACVYATGSFGRGEASEHSDLDIFIVSDVTAIEGTPERPLLDPLDEILIKADLIDAIRAMKIQDFSGGGEYLKRHTVTELIGELGTPEDDASNTFTARLLLLLESSPLLGEGVYRRITNQVIAAYWRDYGDHKNDFIPAFLANDILRMWRTFCVNYEAFTQTDPPDKKAKRKLKNYKLKHSRLLTCYSGLLYLMAIFVQKKTVSPTDAVNMIDLTPTQRLEWLLKQPDLSKAHSTIQKLIAQYEEFLSRTDEPEKQLVSHFMDKKQYEGFSKTAFELGDATVELLDTIGQGNRFRRLVTV